jgi:hypothetical protein
MGQLGRNAHGEVLEPGRVRATSCSTITGGPEPPLKTVGRTCRRRSGAPQTRPRQIPPMGRGAIRSWAAASLIVV